MLVRIKSDFITSCLGTGDREVTSPSEIADTFDTYVTQVGEGLARNSSFESYMPSPNSDFKQPPKLLCSEISDNTTKSIIINCNRSN